MTTTATKKAPTKVDENGLSGERVKVKFQKNPDAGGNPDAAYFSLNGIVYGYQYEKEVEVPVEILDLADNCKMEMFKSDRTGNLQSYEVARFPYSVVRK